MRKILWMTMAFFISGKALAAAGSGGDDEDGGKRKYPVIAKAGPVKRANAVKVEEADTEETILVGGSQETLKAPTAEESYGSQKTDKTLPRSES